MIFLSTYFCSLLSFSWLAGLSSSAPTIPASMKHFLLLPPFRWWRTGSWRMSLISSYWLDFGSLAAAPASPLSLLECLVGRTMGLCTSRWSSTSLNRPLPRAACPPQIFATRHAELGGTEQTFPAETKAKRALSASAFSVSFGMRLSWQLLENLSHHAVLHVSLSWHFVMSLQNGLDHLRCGNTLFHSGQTMM